MSGVVNVWGGECLGGERLTIVFLNLLLACLPKFVPFKLYAGGLVGLPSKQTNSLRGVLRDQPFFLRGLGLGLGLG